MRLKCLSDSGPFRDEIGQLFADFDQLVFFVSLGAVVRLIAPHLKTKDEDPGVLVVDDAGQFVIPVLSGHVGGANAMSEQIAALLGATAVLTTASDVGKTIAVDILGRELGWKVECPKINITRVSAAVVNGEPIALVQEAGSPNWWTRPTSLPATIHKFERFEDVDLNHFKAVLWITHAEVSPERWQPSDMIQLWRNRPPGSLEAGVCPSCNTRRMVETAAHLTDHVLPRLPVRQWVLSVPKRLRYFMQRDGAVLNMVLRILATPKPRFPAGHRAKPAVPLPRRGADGQRGPAHWRSRLHSPI